MAAAHEAPKRVYTYKYPHPAVTVDNLIFCAEAGSLFILLIQRGGAQDSRRPRRLPRAPPRASTCPHTQSARR